MGFGIKNQNQLLPKQIFTNRNPLLNFTSSYWTQRLETDEAVCHYFLNECGVALVPGSAFGSPGHVRMSFAIDQALLDKAVRRLAGAIGQLGGSLC
jgi:aspartate/methionine/tyrosine aminotransferase